MQIKSQNKKD